MDVKKTYKMNFKAIKT